VSNVGLVQMLDAPCVRMRKVAYSLSEFNLCYFGCARGGSSPASELDTIHIGPKIPRRSWKKAFLTPLWILNTAFALRKSTVRLVYSADLEAGLAALLSGKPYIYDVLDTYADRYNIPRYVKQLLRKVEQNVLRESEVGIHVAEYRKITLGDITNKTDIMFIVPNSPLAKDLPLARPNREFDVIATGNIDANRGCDQLLRVASELQLRVALVGRIDEKLKDEHESNRYFTFFNYVSSREALELCSKSRAIFAAYNPQVNINILAAPNKIYDSIFCGTPLVMNREIHISNWIEEVGIGVCFSWNDDVSLRSALAQIKQHDWEKVVEATRVVAQQIKTWDDFFEPVRQWVNSNLSPFN
jgi:hypothetical protein